MRQVSILGDGAFGTVCALLLRHNGLAVRVLGRDPARCEQIEEQLENHKYLPGVTLPAGIRWTSDPAAALDGAELLIAAVPCQELRAALVAVQPLVNGEVPVLSVAKGVEIGSLHRPSQVVLEALGPRPVAALAGPAIAREVAQQLPTTTVVASDDAALSTRIQHALSTPFFRVYTNTDLVGVELGAAVKNVIALAAGIIDGLNVGNNCKAGLITRGLVEMARLGEVLGGRRETFSGLAGLGDLFTTCVSPHSRNRQAGTRLAAGQPLEQILASMGGVVEGVPTTQAVCRLAQQHGVDMPIVLAAHRVLFEGVRPQDAIRQLMLRDPKPEL